MRDKVIIACDFKTRQELDVFLQPFGDTQLFLKVGMELFYKEGRFLVKYLKDQGHKIFLDLKLHDIPNTVKASLSNLKDLDVDFITIHASGGYNMMKAAVEALEGTNTKLLAVTVLTSLDQDMLENELGVNKEIQEHATHLARLAQQAGVYGCICSPHEVEGIKENLGRDFGCVTPGIRLAQDLMDDQKRVMTPSQAIGKGADYLVIGRSITNASSPIETYKNLGDK